jgi:hypothetical protein
MTNFLVEREVMITRQEVAARYAVIQLNVGSCGV